MAFRIMLTEPIVISTALFNAYGYGMVFLYLEGVYVRALLREGASPS
jgi:hypothetical protein